MLTLVEEKPTQTTINWIIESIKSLITRDFYVSEDNIETLVSQFNNPVFRDYIIAYATTEEKPENICNSTHQEIKQRLDPTFHHTHLTPVTINRIIDTLQFIVNIHAHYPHDEYEGEQLDGLAYMFSVAAYLLWWKKDYAAAQVTVNTALELDKNNSLANLVCHILKRNIHPPYEYCSEEKDK